MKRIILSLLAIVGFTALSQAQIKVTPNTTTTTTVKTEPKTTVDFNKKRIIRTEDKTVATETRTTVPTSSTKTSRTVDFENKRIITTGGTRTSGPVIVRSDDDRKYKSYKKKNKKWKSKFANGHDNRTKSKHHNSRGHDNRSKSKHHN